MTKFKGPFFPSFEQQGTPAARQQWVSHTGNRQRLRYLRMQCRDILQTKDPEILKALSQARNLVAGRFEEHGLLMMVAQAKDSEDSTGLPFLECFNYIIDKIKSDLEEQNVQAQDNSGDHRSEDAVDGDIRGGEHVGSI